MHGGEHHDAVDPAIVPARRVRTEDVIPAIGLATFGSDHVDHDTATGDGVIAGIAERRGMDPATMCVTWAEQPGRIPIPFSTDRHHLLANLRAVVSGPPSDDEMVAIAGIDRNRRLIKGQRFCWKPDRSRRDPSDESGVIVAPSRSFSGSGRCRHRARVGRWPTARR